MKLFSKSSTLGHQDGCRIVTRHYRLTLLLISHLTEGLRAFSLMMSGLVRRAPFGQVSELHCVPWRAPFQRSYHPRLL